MKVGARVELHPATDHWMRGDRYGEIVGGGRPYRDGGITHLHPYRVKLDKSERVVRIAADLLTEVQ
jgi:hypothetical protein